MSAARRVVRGRRDRTISFAELVHAHYERQRELTEGDGPGTWEEEYRRRLHLFKEEYGEFVDAYWCRYEASGVAVTDLVTRPARNLFRRDSMMRLHAVTDWRTAHAPRVAAMLHEWETLGIRAGEVLRGTSERITLQRIFAASSRLLAFVDKERPSTPSGERVRDLERAHGRELRTVTRYYERAAENQARIVYFQGMVRGAALLALLVGAAFLFCWALGWLDPEDISTQVFFVTIAMGATGAMLSVTTRMAKAHGFNIDYEVGRKSARFLGSLRPWIGAAFALALYIAIRGGVVNVLPDAERTLYFFAAIAFLAGFSERWAKVLLDGAVGDGDERRDEQRTRSAAEAFPDPGPEATAEEDAALAAARARDA
jgi:hypothetical protein